MNRVDSPTACRPEAEPPSSPLFGKIGPQHRQRRAVVYVRQSTSHQVVEHRESLARQYALKDRAVQLGWDPTCVEVIDEDLGKSGRSVEGRSGFQRLLAAVVHGHVGIVLAIETSRLARNDQDWHHLFQLCSFTDTLLADDDGVYQPREANDRLILGMKGIFSDMELHLMKGRLERGRRNKAQRGELFHSVPWGYVLLPDRTIALDPDEEVRGVVRRVFDAFAELGSAWAATRALAAEGVRLPRRNCAGQLGWVGVNVTAVQTLLHHPLYAGAYAYGRKQIRTRVDEQGRLTRFSRKYLTPESWSVLLLDHCPAYISWGQYLENQRRMSENQPRKAGRPRGGHALAAGIVYCGICDRKMQTEYPNRAGRYQCWRRRPDCAGKGCGSISARILDDLLERQVLDALAPAAVELGLHAVAQARLERQRVAEQLGQRLMRARYKTERAERQYQLTEPENRLVARTLEQRWEEALAEQAAAQECFDSYGEETPPELSEAERTWLARQASDIPSLWRDAAVGPQGRQEIIRCLIERVEIRLEPEQHAVVTLRWVGGYESKHELRRQTAGYKKMREFDELAALVVELRRAGMRAPAIAARLNAEGYVSPKKLGPFTAALVGYLLRRSSLCGGRVNARELGDGEWQASDLAVQLDMPEKKLKDWVRRGWVRAIQRPFGGVWIVWADANEVERLRKLSRRGRAKYTSAHGHCPS